MTDNILMLILNDSIESLRAVRIYPDGPSKTSGPFRPDYSLQTFHFKSNISDKKIINAAALARNPEDFYPQVSSSRATPADSEH